MVVNIGVVLVHSTSRSQKLGEKGRNPVGGLAVAYAGREFAMGGSAGVRAACSGKAKHMHPLIGEDPLKLNGQSIEKSRYKP